MSRLPITLFTDFTCPASYITEAALWRLGDEDIEVRYRAFELFPESAARGTPRFTPEEWGELEELATAAGIEIVPRLELPNTRKAHESSAFARERGSEGALRREIFAGFWGEGRDIGRIDVLAEMIDRVGIEPEDLRIALDIDRFREEVLADEDLAHRLRIPGTPVLFLGEGPEARIVAGARGVEELRSLIQMANRDGRDRTDDV